MHGTHQLPLDLRPQTERDKGMQRAADHADVVNLAWTDRALAFIHEYAIIYPDVVCESIRAYAQTRGLPSPPTARAWGMLMRRAASFKWIQKTDRRQVAADPGVHCNELRVWKSLIYQRQN